MPCYGSARLSGFRGRQASGSPARFSSPPGSPFLLLHAVTIHLIDASAREEDATVLTMASSPGVANDEVIAKVEKVFENIVDNLCQEEPISIVLKYNQSSSSLSGNPEQPSNFRSHSFPGSTPQEAWRFSRPSSYRLIIFKLMGTLAVLFRILGLIHEALASNTVISKRSVANLVPVLLAQDSPLSSGISTTRTPLFSKTKPSSIDMLMSSPTHLGYSGQLSTSLVMCPLGISHLFGCLLFQTAAAKGLVVGLLSITRPDGTIVDKGLDDKVHDPSLYCQIFS